MSSAVAKLQSRTGAVRQGGDDRRRQLQAKERLELQAQVQGQSCAPVGSDYSAVTKRVEISSNGIDEYLQLVGGDAGNDITSTGLRIPDLPWTPPGESPGIGRYLFQLATIKVGFGRRIRLLGLRQYLSIGALQQSASAAAFVVEFPVVSPFWRFSDGNVCWYLRRVAGRDVPKRKIIDTDNFKFRFSDTSANGALVYEMATFPAANLSAAGRPDFYTKLTSYVPPNGGQPYGQSINGQMGCFRDVRFQWEAQQFALNLVIEGPCSVVFYASVRQTNAETRPALTAASGAVAAAAGPENSFVFNYPTARFWRVAGGLVYEDISQSNATAGGGTPSG